MKIAEPGLKLLKLANQFDAMVKTDFAFFCHHEWAFGPVQKLDAEMTFYLVYGLASSRLCYSVVVSGFRKALPSDNVTKYL